MVKKGPDIFIIGAGIIGLMTAKVLVDAGHTVNCIGESYPGLDKEFASPKYDQYYRFSFNVVVQQGHFYLRKMKRLYFNSSS